MVGAKPEFICQIPASVFKNEDLSLAARGFYGLLVAIADAKSGLLRQSVTPADLDRMARCSTPTRLKLERELTVVGLLDTWRNKVPCGPGARTIEGRKFYRVKIRQLFAVPTPNEARAVNFKR